MSEAVGEIGLDLVINQQQYQKQLKGITSMAKKAGAALVAAFSIKMAFDFSKECIKLGSDLQEVQNIVDVTFPHMTAQIDEFAKSAAASFGLSETMAKKFSAMFGTMAKQFGFSEKAAYDMGTTLAGLAGDIASFYDMTQDEAYTKLKAVFSGETEVLKDIGVVMTQNALDAYALANGYGKTTQAMSELEKVSLRYAFVQDQLTAASGDFIRTSDSWANQVRVLKLQFDSLKATIGQGLINLFTPVVKAINAIISKLMVLANAFKAFTELITGKKAASGVQNVAGAATDGFDNAAGAADNLSNATAGTGKAAKKAAKEMKALMGFDEINKISEPDTGDADTGSGGGTGGSIGGSGAVDFGSLAEGETAVDKIDEKFKKLFSDIQQLVEPSISALKRLWNEGLAKLGDFAWTALKDFYQDFLVPVGKWVLGTGFPEFVNTLNDGLMKVDFEKINTSLDNLWKALVPFAINVGEGLLWLWKNVLVPLGTWVANEVVPRFIDTVRIAIEALNKIIEALKPLFQWLWDNVLLPFAKWTADAFLKVWDGINTALTKFGDWCGKNPSVIQAITVTVGSFFAAWKGIELLSFIQQSGGVVASLKNIATALFGATVAKIADKAETMALNAMYAKDFIINLAKTTVELIKQAAIWVKNTALKLADAIAQAAVTAATVLWNSICAIATVVTMALGAAFAFLTSPIGLVILAIGALITAGVLIYKNWDVIKAKAIEIWGAIKDWFSATIESIKGFFSGLWDGIVTIFQNMGQWFQEKFQAAYAAITAVFVAIGAWFQARYTDITNVFLNIHTWFQEKFQAAYTFITTIFSVIGQWFQERYNDIVKAFRGIAMWFKTQFNTAWNSIVAVFKGIGAWFGSRYKEVTNAFSKVAEWFGTKFGDAWKNIKNAFKDVGKFFGDMWNTIKSKFTDIGTKIGDAIGGAFRNAMNKVFETVENAINTGINLINGALGFINALTGGAVGTVGTVQLPRIQALAQGGYVKANTPQLAMIGDNRHQGEVVAPEDKLQEMVDTAVAKASGSGFSSEAVALLKQLISLVEDGGDIVLMMDGQELARAEQRAALKLKRRFVTTGVVFE